MNLLYVHLTQYIQPQPIAVLVGLPIQTNMARYIREPDNMACRLFKRSFTAKDILQELIMT